MLQASSRIVISLTNGAIFTQRKNSVNVPSVKQFYCICNGTSRNAVHRKTDQQLLVSLKSSLSCYGITTRPYKEPHIHRRSLDFLHRNVILLHLFSPHTHYCRNFWFWTKQLIFQVFPRLKRSARPSKVISHEIAFPLISLKSVSVEEFASLYLRDAINENTYSN